MMNLHGKYKGKTKIIKELYLGHMKKWTLNNKEKFDIERCMNYNADDEIFDFMIYLLLENKKLQRHAKIGEILK